MRHWSARTPCASTIPSCLTGKVRFPVINVLNGCCICMCMYAKISGQIYFKRGGGGGECKTRENFKFEFFR